MGTTEIGQYLELKLAMRSQEAQTQWDNLTTDEQSQATTILANYIYHNKPIPLGYVEAVSTLSETGGLETLEEEAKAAIGDDTAVIFECTLPEFLKTHFGREKWEEICDRQGWVYVIVKCVIRRLSSVTMFDEALRVYISEEEDEEDEETETSSVTTDGELT